MPDATSAKVHSKTHFFSQHLQHVLAHTCYSMSSQPLISTALSRLMRSRDGSPSNSAMYLVHEIPFNSTSVYDSFLGLVSRYYCAAFPAMVSQDVGHLQHRCNCSSRPKILANFHLKIIWSCNAASFWRFWPTEFSWWSGRTTGGLLCFR